ncbi:MAG: UvrD-helicase domain-containing protein, partial [Acidobacteriota bacterium]
MPFYADLHIHSKYSRATSRNCDLEHLALWARRKGLGVIATGDFTHPAWFDEIRDKLVPAEPGLFRLRPELEKEIDAKLPSSCAGPTRFMLEVEISTIYKKGDRTRKVHHLIYAPDIDTASRFRDRLGTIGNIKSDGRPILGLDSRDLLEITLESGPDAYLVPAHIWTPWFAALGSKSGFDSIEDCYGDLTGHIFAVETGLSSDPPMNWRVSGLDRFTLVSNSDAHSPPMLGREACVFDTELDYFAMRRALETGEGYGGTVEFFPEEGKYHLDGHRACQLRLEPEETRRFEGRCPTCNKPLTVGVMHRVETLADRDASEPPEGAAPFKSIVPLPEIVSELCGVGPKSKAVGSRVAALVARHGPELDILERLPLEDLRRDTDPLISEAIERLRAGQVFCEGGYDGEYGVIRLFEPGELEARAAMPVLFELPEPEPAKEPEVKRREPWEEAAARRAEAAEEPETEIGDAGPPPPPPVTSLQLPFDAAPPPTLLDRLDADQRVAAEVINGPLLIIAGPGTGKTRTLTHRIAHLIETDVALPEECLAITFTRRAAAELAERLEELLGARAQRVTVKTFHGLGLVILREQRAELGLHRGFRIAEASQQLEVASQLFELTSSQATKLLRSFSLARRQRAASPEDLRPEGQQPPAAGQSLDDPIFSKLQAYEEALWQRDLVELDDLLVLPTRVLAERDDLRAAYRHRFAWISID